MQHADTLILILMSLIVGSIVFCIWRAKRGHIPYVRPIGGIASLEEAVGRATELGRPVVFAMGGTDLKAIQTHAALSILAHVARVCARLHAPLITCVRMPDVYPYTEEIMREAYKAEGVLDQFDAEDQVRYLSSDSIVYAMSVGRVIEEEPAGCALFFGAFDFTSLMMAEPGAQLGVIQIAGDPGLPQIPFFVCTCDYTIMGEEFFAAGAYLSPDPALRGSLLSQDIIKVLFGGLIVVGLAAALLKCSDPKLVTTASRLTFSPDNWDVAQTVTLEAHDDGDRLDGSGMFRLVAEGIPMAGVVVSVKDDDAEGLMLSESSLQVHEGGDASFTLRLPYKPTADIPITVERALGSDPDLSVEPSRLDFGPDNWDQPQTITIRAAQDRDKKHGSTSFQLASFAYPTKVIRATELDDDVPIIDITPLTALRIPEGASLPITVSLSAAPSEREVVRIERIPEFKEKGRMDKVTSDSDLTSDLLEVVFTPEDWGEKTILITAADDPDSADGKALFKLTCPTCESALTAELAASEVDDDILRAVPSVEEVDVPEMGEAEFTVLLSARPLEPILLDVRAEEGADPDISTAPNALTFTPENWDQPQVVRVSAARDEDGAKGAARIRLTSASLTPVAVRAVESDTHSQALVVEPGRLTLSEGGRSELAIRLTTRPTEDIRIDIRQESPSNGAFTTEPETLVFTASDWPAPQTVTFLAAPDANVTDDEAVFAVSAPALETRRIVVNEIDNHAQRFILSALEATLDEGGKADFGVRLARMPDSIVNVDIERYDGVGPAWLSEASRRVVQLLKKYR